MANQTRPDISTKELAVRVENELQSFHDDQLITSSTYSKCRKYINIIRGINHADRIVTRDMDLSAIVVVFVPADTNNVILSENYRYWNEYIKDIRSQDDLISRDKNYFLGKNKFLNILSINDRFINIFSEYPAGGQKQDARFYKVSYETYQDSQRLHRSASGGYYKDEYSAESSDPQCYFSVDEGRMVLGTQFESPRFLQFGARIMPGNVSLDDISDSDKSERDWDVYQVLAPHWAMELIIYETLLWVLPTSARDARTLAKEERAYHKQGLARKKPGDSNTIVPHFSF